ncbi:GAF domain-containing sensor histidine kinase [Alteromonas flava]|uniref:sensor histidine kinase n=1 Tax=Alteromonas flava TaxID=2048003 RepID=UPI000C289A03|nr:GAF domain-containing sensor histidine kinase [Alteromonas flava]
MSKKPEESVSTEQITQLKNRSAVEIGRAKALDQLISGAPLKTVAHTMLQGIEEAHPGARCIIMLLNEDKITLSPLVAPSFSSDLVKAFANFPVGANSGCCGAAVFHKKPVYVANVQTSKDWQPVAAIAKQARLKACWSTPLISPEGEVYGSLALYPSERREPSEDDIYALDYEAKILSVIIERSRMISALKKSHNELELRVAERTKELSEANVLLSKALDQRNEVRMQLLEMENMAALGTMMSSLTHEINTPIGVAITAATYLRAMQQKSKTLFEQNALKRSDLEAFYLECGEASEIIERNLARTSQLITTFKQLSTDQHSQEPRSINVIDYIDEILLSLKPRLKRFGHLFCLDVNPALEIQTNPGALGQILINLIMNSAIHAFEPGQRGRITIRGRIDNSHDQNAHLLLDYRDNGKGMSEHTVANIYKPFFTNARNNGGTGLGMHICYNLAVDVLKGTLDCESVLGKGTLFRLRIPVNNTESD